MSSSQPTVLLEHYLKQLRLMADFAITVGGHYLITVGLSRGKLPRIADVGVVTPQAQQTRILHHVFVGVKLTQQRDTTVAYRTARAKHTNVRL
jgi:hypothetical protein